MYFDKELVPESTLARGEFYQVFLPQFGIESMTALVQTPQPHATISIGIQNAPGTVPHPQDKRLLSLLSRHISRAVMASSQIRTLTARREVLLATFGRFECAVALVRPDRRVTAGTERLYELKGMGLSVRQSRLGAEDPKSQGALDRYIAAASSGAILPDGPPVLILHRAISVVPLLARAIPVTPQRIERQIGSAERASSALLLIIDADSEPQKLGQEVLQAMGLTKA